MNVESYIKDLDPELQEKARACDSAQELLALATRRLLPSLVEKVPIPGTAQE